MSCPGFSQKIGEGAEGMIYLVQGNESRVVKIGISDNIHSEAALLSYLNKENCCISQIPIIYGSGKFGEYFWMEMSRQPGEDLIDILEKNGVFGEDELKIIFYRLSLIIKKLHKKKIAHLDIKLENVIYDKKNHFVSLVDFGASLNVPTKKKKPIFINHPIGTDVYNAPEMKQKKVDNPFKCDSWSLGCSIYACLTGNFLPSFESSLDWKDCLPIDCSLELKLLLSELLQENPRKRLRCSKVTSCSWFSKKDKKFSRKSEKIIISEKMIKQQQQSFSPRSASDPS